MRFLRLLCAACAIFKVNCATIDRNPSRVESNSFGPASHGVLAEVARSAKSTLGEKESAFHLIVEAEEALQWRLALVDHAEESIDLQYYLWNIDEAGLLLLSRLLDAADRGVRVRMLIDDLLFPGEEHRLAALCHHPNVEIRIYNPQFVRGSGLASKLEVLARFGELNRRMHNKAFLVDGQIAIMGGRNVGNEYFGLKQAYNFVDLDVMTAGPVVAAAAASFDRYWNHVLSHPGEAFSPETGSDEMRSVVAGVHQYVREEEKILPRSPFPKTRTDWSRRWDSLAGSWHVGPAIFIDDAPDQRGDLFEGRFLEKAISQIGEPAEEEVLFTSPYLIPGRKVHRALRGYTERGVEFKLLTASMGANNHLFVHSHYRPHRQDLLEDGADLLEFREDAIPGVRAFADTTPVASDKLALHVKAGVGDRKRCFIGSLNLDPRAINLNTENGLIIDCPPLAEEVADFLDQLMADESAWRVSTTKSGVLRWESRGEVLKRQPAPDRKSRVQDFLWGLLPIRHLL